jgi:hypothetical protein
MKPDRPRPVSGEVGPLGLRLKPTPLITLAAFVE